MKNPLPVLILAILPAFLAMPPAPAQNKQLHLAPQPDWVVPIKPVAGSPASKDISNGYYVSLLEVQTHVELNTTYLHKIQRIVSETGVQNASEISVDFNPAHEKLTFHKVVIHRGGQSLDRLQAKDFKILQNESDLSRFLYNESYQAYLILEDVQKGDEIEVAYSLTGRNPILQGKFFDDFYFYSRAPIVHLYRNILFSPARQLYFKSFNNPPVPAVSTQNGLTVHEWRAERLKSEPAEEYEPSWLDDVAHVQISEFASWKEVAEWGQALHRFTAPMPAELVRKIDAWRGLSGNDKVKFTEFAARFVQDEIRYMGIEIGEHSHRPHDPGRVFRQRFGDCKDKSVLLCAILRTNGIEASPALVNTYYGDKITHFLPSPFVFNHEVVMAEIEGRHYWIDPTISLQRGVLADNYFPRYGKALLLKPMENGLRAITGPPAGKITVSEVYRVGRVGEDATLEVESGYAGNFADDIRSQFASTSVTDLEKNYLNFYSNSNKDFHIELADSLQYEDDQEGNRFKTFEKYDLKEIWKQPDSSKRQHTLAFFGQILNEKLRSLPDKKRRNPILIDHPYELDYTIKIFLPEAWTASDEEKTISRESYAFGYQASYDAAQNAITLHYTYKTLRDFVPSAKSSEYIRDVNEINKHLSYTLTWNLDVAENVGATNKWMVGLGLLALVVFAYLALRMYRLSLPATASGLDYARPLGGWLILLLIGMCATPLVIVFSLFENNFFDLGTWQATTLLETGQGTLYQATLVFEMVANVFLLCYAVLVIILFAKRRNTLPKFIIGFYLGSLAVQLINLLLCSQLDSVGEKEMGSLGKELARAVLYAAIWVPYFLRSVRVKETFVYPYDESCIQQEAVVEDETESVISAGPVE